VCDHKNLMDDEEAIPFAGLQSQGGRKKRKKEKNY
jgi:hypothetical protein